MNPTYQEVKAALKEKGLRIKRSGSNQGIPTYEVVSLSDITGGGRILWLSDVISIYLEHPDGARRWIEFMSGRRMSK